MTRVESSKTQTESEGAAQVQNFLRRPQVCQITGLKTSTLYEMMQEGTFPRPICISKRLVVWPESDIAEWQAARLAERENTNSAQVFKKKKLNRR